MPDLKRIIVVDTGDRGPDATVSAELAELGIMSVTLSLEAAGGSYRDSPGTGRRPPCICLI